MTCSLYFRRVNHHMNTESAHTHTHTHTHIHSPLCRAPQHRHSSPRSTIKHALSMPWSASSSCALGRSADSPGASRNSTSKFGKFGFLWLKHSPPVLGALRRGRPEITFLCISSAFPLLGNFQAETLKLSQIKNQSVKPHIKYTENATFCWKVCLVFVNLLL